MSKHLVRNFLETKLEDEDNLGCQGCLTLNILRSIDKGVYMLVDKIEIWK